MGRSPEYWARWDHYQKYGYFPKSKPPLSKAQDAAKEAPKKEEPATDPNDGVLEGLEDVAPTTKPKKRPETGPAGHIDWNHIDMFRAPKAKDEEEEKPL